MAERLTQAILRERIGAEADALSVTSAGTRAAYGRPMHPLAAAELKRRGIPAADFASRPIDRATLNDIDLVLAATRRIRDDVLAMAPALLGKVFTWHELAWLLSGLSSADVPGRNIAEWVGAVPEIAKRRRGHLNPLPPGQFDVIDPLSESKRNLTDTFEEISHSLVAVFDLL